MSEAARIENGTPSHVSLTVPAKAEYVIVARLALDGLASAAPLSQEALSDLKLALTEACANSVAHAYTGDEGLIRVGLSVLDDRVLVEVVDEGVGLEQPEVREFSEDEEIRESGMGLALISALVDELEIGSGAEGRGTRIAFSKHLS